MKINWKVVTFEVLNRNKYLNAICMITADSISALKEKCINAIIFELQLLLSLRVIAVVAHSVNDGYWLINYCWYKT
jgi:hypothetical protein